MKLMKAATLAPPGAALGVLAAVITAGPASAASGDCVTASKVTTCTFTYTAGAQTWTVPAGVKSATFTLYGGEGGTAVGGTINSVPVPGGPGGLGAQVTGTLPVTPGTVLRWRQLHRHGRQRVDHRRRGRAGRLPERRGGHHLPQGQATRTAAVSTEPRSYNA
jgi:hypothetical protein